MVFGGPEEKEAAVVALHPRPAQLFCCWFRTRLLAVVGQVHPPTPPTTTTTTKALPEENHRPDTSWSSSTSSQQAPVKGAAALIIEPCKANKVSKTCFNGSFQELLGADGPIARIQHL